MLCRTFPSQRGFSLIKILLALAIFAVAVFYILPYIGGDTQAIVNQISGKIKVVVNALLSKSSELGGDLWNWLSGHWTKILRTLEEWADKWNLEKVSRAISQVEDEWEIDIAKLIVAAESRGFDMSRVELKVDEYDAKKVSWKLVESTLWEDLQQQTQDKIMTSIERFRTRQLGCSDFVVELRTIWDIEQQFNEDGYFEASESADRLQQPRSAAFLEELLAWLAVASVYPSSKDGEGDWFMARLKEAIPSASQSATPDYPGTIKQIDSQVNGTPHPIYRILGDVTIAEIYLNYDLLNPAEDRFDEAIRQLSEIVARYQSTYNLTSLGLHMALGLLHERVCKNADLAMKEFKDVVAIARRLGLHCEDYNYSIVHYHLGVLNLRLRETKEVKSTFEEAPPFYSGTTQELLAPTPTPVPTPVPPTPTPKPDPIEISIKIPRALETVTPSGTPPERPTEGTGILLRKKVDDWKGEPWNVIRRLERDIRLRPRPELGTSKKMKKFDINDLYDLTKIPDDAIREFELYLQCPPEWERRERTTIARFIHDKYLGK